MKARHVASYIMATLLLLCLGMNEVKAQDIIDVKLRIKVVNKIPGDNGKDRIDTIPQIVYFGIMRDMAAAQKAKAELIKINNEAGLTKEKFRDKCRAIGIGRETKGNGTFSTRAVPGMVILAVTKNGNMSTDGKGNIPSVNIITAGKNYYNVVIETHDLIGGGVIGKMQTVQPPPLDTGDGTITFPIKCSIPKDSVGKTTRIIVQPYAIDCMRDDTMSYLVPIVFEGDFYHALQDKRRAFDYFKYDSLANNYYSFTINGFQEINPEDDKKSKLSRNYLNMVNLRNQKAQSSKKDTVTMPSPATLAYDSISKNFVVEATIKYILPKKDSMCRGAYVCALEDLHRVYYTNIYPGTCLANRPFKFLDFSAGMPSMELSTDFQEPAEENIAKVDERLNLRFLQGKAELIQDSINELERDKMVKVLSNQEGLLGQSVSIVATSSPEGSDKINQDLAVKRAGVAKQYLSQLLRGISPKTSTKIYKWSDVADRLAGIGKRQEAQAVRDLIEANGNNKPALDRAIRQLEFYEPLIGPILTDMRVMTYSYLFERKHIMTEDEVVQSYYSHKHDYLSGKNKLSSGDFYNLYYNIHDSLELDTITMMAYKYLEPKTKDLSALYSERIAPYVLNRMARRLLDNGTPDTLMLAPFIDEPSDTLFDKPLDRKRQMLDVPEVCMNYTDILITQAMNYYQLQMFPRAHKYIEWIKGMSKKKDHTAALDKIQKYMDLMMYFGNEENRDEFKQAKKYVMESSPDNKAILYTEVPEWRTSFEDTNDLLDLMDDENPKKWYLKGMLWSERAEGLEDSPTGEPDLTRFYPEDEFRILTDDEEADLMMHNYPAYEAYEKEKQAYLEAHKDDDEKEHVSIEGIKHYLAYFHHSFKLGGDSFKRFYYYEGRISEEMRKKFLYLKKDFAAYEELFKLLKARDDENRAELRGEATDSDDDEELLKNLSEQTQGGDSTDTTTPVTETNEEDTKE